MCGIAVITNATDGEVEAMLAQLGHRGPDELGMYVQDADAVALGHARLAIMDPSGGHQPMVDTAGRAAVSNGEIYNHASIRQQLRTVESSNNSDAAVLLPLFERSRSTLAEYLDGMFAFVILTEDGTLVAGRDRLGIKPLYRAGSGDRVAYASEMKPLIDGGWSDIQTVPPGHVWIGDDLQRYWELPDPTTSDNDQPKALGTASSDAASIDAWCEELRQVLEAAVLKRLMSDVPLGAFLSGGLDSSIIAALAAKHQPGLATFALGFEGSGDLEAAAAVAEHLGTTHHEILVSEQEALAALPDALRHLESWDRDLVRSALPTYIVAEFASRHVKVVLTGEGADELFAGYRYHRDYSEHPRILQRELHRSVAAMHNSNLQRVDRMTMAHSLEARVPFLDPTVVELAMRIPASLKVVHEAGGITDKWILRRAFADLLPSDIAARPKAQFDEGSGTAERLPQMARAALGPAFAPIAGAAVRDLEEAWYFEQLRDAVGDWRQIQTNTSVWDQERLATPEGTVALTDRDRASVSSPGPHASNSADL